MPFAEALQAGRRIECRVRALWGVSARPGPDAAEGFAQQALSGSARERDVAAQLGEHGLHLAFAEAEVAQGREDFGVCVDGSGRRRVTVRRAIGVAEGETPVTVAFAASCRGVAVAAVLAAASFAGGLVVPPKWK